MMRTRGWRAGAGVITVGCATAMLLMTPALAASPPAPVSDLSLSSRDAVVYADWTPSPDTSSAVVCWQPDTAPATPQDTGATCSDPTTAGGFSFAATAGTTYGVSVFSYDSGTATYGSPASGTVLAIDAPPYPPVHLASQAASYSDASHSLDLNWQDDARNADTADFVINWAAGTASPPFADDALHVSTRPWATIGSLETDVVYTFAVYTRDKGGNVSDPTLLRAAARAGGVWLRSWDAAGAGALSWARASDVTTAATSQMDSSGHLRLLSRTTWSVGYTSRPPGSDWQGRCCLASVAVAPGTAYLGAPSSGNNLAATWNTLRGVIYALRTGSGWQPLKYLTRHAKDRVAGATQDTRRAHLLFRRPSGDSRGLWYATIAGSHVTKSRVPGAGGSDAAFMTRDQVTGKVVIVDRHRTATANLLRVAVLDPAATSVPAMRTWRTTSHDVDLRPTSVASDSGHITVGLQRSTVGGSSLDGPYVAQGTATSHHAPVRVAGTSSHDKGFVVTALQAHRAILTWRRASGSWSPSAIGVWTSQLLGDAGASHFTSPVRRSTSAYDDPVAAYRDDAGHFYVLYFTHADDITE